MNRKNFIKNSGIGLALSLFPLISFSQIKTFKLLDSNSLPKLLPKIVRKEQGKLLNVLGDQQTIKLTGKDTNGQFTLIEEFNEPGTGIPPHVHENEDEIFKVLEGQMELTVGNETTVLKAGDLALGPRGIPHSWKIIGDKKAKVILSVFPSGIEDMFEELSQLPPGPPNFQKVAEICENYGVKFI